MSTQALTTRQQPLGSNLQRRTKRAFMGARIERTFVGVLIICSPWMIPALLPTGHGSIAYGTLNNFDCVNDTGVEAHGFEIELDDIHSTDVTYTYDYNHYGIPKITEDNSDPLHPKVFIRYAASKKADGTWSAYTAIPSGPIAPTQGHQFTDPTVNFGGEHFGAGYSSVPTAIKYNWLIDDGTGNLVHGPPVNVATPTFTYNPPVAAAPPNVVAQIVPPPPPAPPPLQFGDASWVKEIKTTTHNANKVELVDLIDPDPDQPAAKNWANGEPAEVEVEWKLLQTEFANAANPKGVLQGAAEDLPNGDEVITRRYEFYKYTGPLDVETGEAVADAVGADGIHGVGSVSYANSFDINGEPVVVTVDTSTLVIVGDFFGAQMAGFDVAPALGLIDHIPDGDIDVPYTDRMIVAGGNTPYNATIVGGTIPNGLSLDSTGVLTGTPAASGVFSFSVAASDADAAHATKQYTLNIAAPVTTERSGIRYSRAKHRFVQNLTIRNTGASALAGPLSIVVKNLPNNVTVFNKSGDTAATPPVGSPYVDLGVVGSLGTGQAATVTLEFDNPLNKGIVYNTGVQTGPGTR